jgi:hypothetical protein
MKRPRKRRQLGIVLAAVLLFGVGTAVAAVAVSGDGDRSVTGTQVAPPTTSEAPAPSAVSANLQAAFSVFRRPAAPADAPDADLARRFRTIGANPDLARLLVASDTPQHRFYAVPGRADTLCLVDGTASGGCLPVEVAIERGTVGSDECAVDAPAGRILVYGLVPDGVDEVRLIAPDGSVSLASVPSNVWKTTVARSPAAARASKVGWTTRSGQEARYAIPYSPDVEEPCR